jgi:hypothetical protein
MSPEARERSFDELARELASGSLSRRKALRLMGAALVGGALASIPGIASAAPKPKPAGRKCKEDSQCQTGVCVNGVCGGFVEKCHNCPADCACVVDEGGNIRCIDCSGGLCALRSASSCADCGSDVCIPERFGVACATPCLTIGQA